MAEPAGKQSAAISAAVRTPRAGGGGARRWDRSECSDPSPSLQRRATPPAEKESVRGEVQHTEVRSLGLESGSVACGPMSSSVVGGLPGGSERGFAPATRGRTPYRCDVSHFTGRSR